MNNQMNNAVRKIHSLQSSGAVTVTGLNQPRILKQKTVATHSNSIQQVSTVNRCYVCDEALNANQAQHQLTEMQTPHTGTKFPNKIGQLVGDAFMVIVSVEDVVCSRCTNLLNYLDRLENDAERVRTNLMNLLHKKYGLNDEGGGNASPPVKMQKLNSGTVTTRTAEDGGGEVNRVRKLLYASGNDSALGKQSPPVSAVQQIKISPQAVQQSSAGTQTLQRKTTKIYKCLSCDYKTSDMRLFNTHYETCKQQNFQCKNCKKIFPNFGTMKQHMVREHNTSMDNTCAVCHVNFVNESMLRKHMETNHSTNVVVTSTATLPAHPTVESITSSGVGTPLYTCNHCQFKSTDKALFDEHLRKHLSGVKPKPFKCRLCSQRFETREAATVHAKQHQPNYRCGTCAVSFPKRELLVKHFEVHQQQQSSSTASASASASASAPTSASASTSSVPTTVQQVTTQPITTVVVKQQQPKVQAPVQNSLTTQKLLQETIDEALSDAVNVNVNTTVAGAGAGGGGGAGAEASSPAANNIRFFSCHICSLTFIQEGYFNQHMETHRPNKEGGSVSGATTSLASTETTNSNNSARPTSLNTSAIMNKIISIEENKGNGEGGSAGGTQSTSGTGGGGNESAGISEADIESIFEKMHSDKGDGSSDPVATSAANTNTTNTASATSGGAQSGMVITSQEGSGGITFNITIPQPSDGTSGEQPSENSKSVSTTSAPVSVSIDMPMIDQPEETTDESDKAGKADAKEGKSPEEKSKESAASKTTAAPVSMPSLDDDNDTHEEHEESQDGSKSQSQESENGETTKKTTEEKVDKNGIKEEENKPKASDSKSSGSANDSTGNENVQGDVESEAVAEGDENTEANAGGTNEDDTGTRENTPHEHLSSGGDHHVAMELDEAMQAQVESGQIKFILNENGQLLQLDNHIITDADGNQILVQDPEQIQQLLQSVGVLQSGDGLDGETLQMMTDGNGQMVLVQGENNDTQLIDASLLNADGQLVIQPGQDGELCEGAHVIGEDGTRIPVSVSYTADGQPIVQVQQQVLEAVSGEGAAQHVVLEKDASATVVTTGGNGGSHRNSVTEASGATAADGNTTGDGGGNGTGRGSGGDFFALDDLMHQSSDAKAAE